MEISIGPVRRLDRLLRTAVERALEPNSGATIGVAATGHVVGLSGLVRTEAERASAVDTARGIAGVVTILDDIVVMNSIQAGRTAHEIALDVDRVLATSRPDVAAVRATVRGGIVTLTGVVDVLRQKHALVFAVKAVKGVTWVSDEIVGLDCILRPIGSAARSGSVA